VVITDVRMYRDDHGIPIPIGNPVGIPWEWELLTQLEIGMGRNEMGMTLIPMGINSYRRTAGAVFSLCNINAQFIIYITHTDTHTLHNTD